MGGGGGLTSWSLFAHQQLHTNSCQSQPQTAEPQRHCSHPHSTQPPCPSTGPGHPLGHLSGAKDQAHQSMMPSLMVIPRENSAFQLFYTPHPYHARGDDHLVVVSQMHCVPLSITQASWNCGADHCVGFTCGKYACGMLSGVLQWHLPTPLT